MAFQNVHAKYRVLLLKFEGFAARLGGIIKVDVEAEIKFRQLKSFLSIFGNHNFIFSAIGDEGLAQCCLSNIHVFLLKTELIIKR